MALAVVQQPQAFTPAYNPQIFVATTPNYTQPGFTYTIVVTDLITSQTITYEVAARPTGELTWDAMPFSQNLVKDYIPLNGLAGFQRCVDGIRKIRVNVGETYSGVYHVGANIDYIVWNAIVDTEDFADYIYTDYVYDITLSNFKFFRGVVTDVGFEDRSSFLYCLSAGAGDFTQLQINTFNAAGGAIGVSTIANPFAASATYTDKYVAIDVGHKGLTNIAGGLVTGTYPIMTPAVARWTVIDSTPFASSTIKTITLGLEPRWAISAIHYLAKNGAFLSACFSKISEKTQETSRRTFKKNPWFLSAAPTYTYQYSDAVETILETITQDRLKLRTDWLSAEQVMQYKDLFDSPKCYYDIGSSKKLRAVLPVPGTYNDIPHYNKKLIMYEPEFRPTTDNARQHA